LLSRGSSPQQDWDSGGCRGALPRWRYLGPLLVVALLCAAAAVVGRSPGRRGRLPVASLGAKVVAIENFPTPPSLFCISVTRAGGAEQDLVVAQFNQRASIFACDGFTVLSSAAFLLGRTDLGEVWPIVIPMPNVSTHAEVMNGQQKRTYLNAQTFISAWDAILEDGQLWMHDWTVKVDPDTVFFPDRLRLHVMPHKGASLYFQNCKPAESPTPIVFGSLEVYSHKAMEIYAANKERCKSGFQWSGWSEAQFMQSCMDLLGVGHQFDRSLLGDSRCDAASCSDWTRVSFHPYKELDGYFDCLHESLRQTL